MENRLLYCRITWKATRQETGNVATDHPVDDHTCQVGPPLGKKGDHCTKEDADGSDVGKAAKSVGTEYFGFFSLQTNILSVEVS